MSIAETSRFFQSQYPVVHADLTFGGFGQTRRASAVVTPELPGPADKGTPGLVLVRNQSLTPIHVFRGGSIEIAIGLYAAPGDDWAKQFIDLAKSVSEAVSVAPVSAALAVAEPIKAAFDTLLHRGRLTLQVGLKVDLISAGLDKHRQLVLVATEESVEPQHLTFDGNCVRHRGRALLEVDYLVLELDVLADRPDLQTLPIAATAARALHEAAGALARGGESTETVVGEIYRRFVAQAFVDESTTARDRMRMIAGLRAQIADLRGAIRAPTFRAGAAAIGHDLVHEIQSRQPSLLEPKLSDTGDAALSLSQAMALPL